MIMNIVSKRNRDKNRIVSMKVCPFPYSKEMAKEIIKTNAIDNREHKVLVKPFSCDAISWDTEAYTERRTQGVLRIFPETMQIEIVINKGCLPFAEDIFAFLLKDKDVRVLIRLYQLKGWRVRQYTMSYNFNLHGSEDFYINFVDDTELIIDRKHLLHISNYGKIKGIKKMYIGDFVELIAKYKEENEFNIARAITSCKYEKPHFVEKSDIRISHLI